METTFKNTESSETNEQHKLLNLSQRLDYISSIKHVALQNLSIYYMWKNIRKQYKNKKLKHGMMISNYQMVLILNETSKIISSTSLQSMKH